MMRIVELALVQTLNYLRPRLLYFRPRLFFLAPGCRVAPYTLPLVQYLGQSVSFRFFFCSTTGNLIPIYPTLFFFNHKLFSPIKFPLNDFKKFPRSCATGKKKSLT